MLQTEITRPKKLKTEERVNLVRDLLNDLLEIIGANLGQLNPPQEPAKSGAKAVVDARSGARVVHATVSTIDYLRLTAVANNLFQRPPFDHLQDPIYRRLIRAMLQLYLIPESKIAGFSDNWQKAQKIEDVSSYSIIDGLQRRFCYGLAILLLCLKDEVVTRGLLTQEEYDKQYAKILEEAELEKVLQQPVRLELFYNIDISGLLHWMVTTNTAQRQMATDIQLEIMQHPLLVKMKQDGIDFLQDSERMPGRGKPRDQFRASDLVTATRAYLEANPQVRKKQLTESFLEADADYLQDPGDVDVLSHVLRRLTRELHPALIDAYDGQPQRQYILSSKETVTIAVMAAFGKLAREVGRERLDMDIDRLMKLFDGSEDPWDLETYESCLQDIQYSRGRHTRNLIYHTFLPFLLGATSAGLDWDQAYTMYVKSAS